MFFSVIIPTHNDSKHLPKLLRSMASQTFTDFETIIIADACNDEELDATCELVDVYKDKLKITFEIVNFGNAGMARNAGLDRAKGQFILFADDDDYFSFICCTSPLAVCFTSPEPS